jgi:hypothetical protein
MTDGSSCGSRSMMGPWSAARAMERRMPCPTARRTMTSHGDGPAGSSPARSAVKSEAMVRVKEIYDAATRYWYEQLPPELTSHGHPGPSGPSGGGEVWSEEQGYLDGAICALQQVAAYLSKSNPSCGEEVLET